MPRVVHFEIHADNPERAVNFYSKLFGWEFTKWGGPMDYHLVKTGPEGQPGINGGLIRRQGAIDGTAVIAYVCTVDVPSVDQYAATKSKSEIRISKSETSSKFECPKPKTRAWVPHTRRTTDYTDLHGFTRMKSGRAGRPRDSTTCPASMSPSRSDA